MLEWLKETLIGLGCLAGLWLFMLVYNIYSNISEKDSKKGRLAKKFGNICWGTFLTYMIITSFVIPLIVVIIWLFL
jgi:hypothetical protein